MIAAPRVETAMKFRQMLAMSPLRFGSAPGCRAASAGALPLPKRQARAAPAAVTLNLPRDLSPWGMFMAADIVVKAVMIGLVFASVLTWTIWFAKRSNCWARAGGCARRSQRSMRRAPGARRARNCRTADKRRVPSAARRRRRRIAALGRRAVGHRRARNASPRGWSGWRPPPAGG